MDWLGAQVGSVGSWAREGPCAPMEEALLAGLRPTGPLPLSALSKVQESAQAFNPGLLCVACGSYRRGKATCGDVDVLLTHPDGRSHQGIFSRLLDSLRQRGKVHLWVSRLARGRAGRPPGVKTLTLPFLSRKQGKLASETPTPRLWQSPFREETNSSLHHMEVLSDICRLSLSSGLSLTLSKGRNCYARYRQADRPREGQVT